MLVRVVILVFAAVVLATAACDGSSTDWNLIFSVGEGGAFGAGVSSTATGGYEGQSLLDLSHYAGILMPLYRQTGPNWAGSTGFYSWDYMPPIPSGTSKTWSDIYLWSQNWTPTLGDRVGIGRTTSQAAPAGYWASLVIDYVPASLNWTGPMQYDFPLDRQVVGVGYFPVPIASDPYDPMQVTRLHLTVYAPEPSSLLALLAGLGGLGGMMWRRRR